MSRLFELKSHACNGDVATIIDLDKICWLQIEKKPGEHYPHLAVRFVDGRDWHDLMIDQTAYRLVDAYRAYLAGRASPVTESGLSKPPAIRPRSNTEPSPVAPASSKSVSPLHN